MGTYSPDYCFITDCPTKNKISSIDAIEYFVEFGSKNYYFEFKEDHKNSDFVENNKYVLKGLLLNNKFPYTPNQSFFTNERLEKIIQDSIIPRSPKEKIDNLLEYLFSIQTYDGCSLEVLTSDDLEGISKSFILKILLNFTFI